VPGIERGDQRGLIDQWSARGINEIGAFFHFGESGGVHQSACRRQERRVHRDEVGAGEEIVKAHALDAGGVERLFCHVKIVGEHFQSE
jgi:hypothetical protein